MADVKTCMELRASHYITKPLDLVGYEGVARAIEGFWLSIDTAGEAS